MFSIASKIKNKVEELLKDSDLSKSVDVEAIAAKLGITITHLDFGDVCSASLIVKDKKCYIGVNSKEPSCRQRFSIAHEIGHYLLHKSHFDFLGKEQFINCDDVSSKGCDPLEIEANAFAAELLMPEDKFRAKWKEYQMCDPLSKFFDVSNQTVEFRAKNLGLI